jgi:transcriptional regulator with XRE-family HTH domain
VQFHEKLKRRVEQLGLNKARAAKGVGLPASTISSYLAKKISLPRVDIALKIAKAIDVPLEWLADDNEDWPPPAKTDNQKALADFSEVTLMLEVVHRRILSRADVYRKLEQIEKINWRMLAERLSSIPENRKLPAEVLREAELLLSLYTTWWRVIKEIDYPALSKSYNHNVLGADVEELTLGVLADRYKRMLEVEDVAKFLAKTVKRPEIFYALESQHPHEAQQIAKLVQGKISVDDFLKG